jgi:protein-tyrosine phosphatase/membrane-associated phospholipid phosphatase
MWDIHRVGGPARRILILRAAGTSLLLSLLFVIVYGGTNWLTAQRPSADVHTWYFEWELTFVPYVPMLIVPYMSLDIFFFMATFLCRDERELRTFSQRVVFSIMVAAVFFLLLPLKLNWPERPSIGGWFGDFVEQSCKAPFLMEYPHNLFPSLHIVLCLIVADIYARHSSGIVRFLLCTWFVLIGISTLLTWQHHLVDLAGGLILAGFAFYVFRESDSRRPVTPNVRVGCYYMTGAVLVVMLAKVLGPWGAFLLWPAVGLGLTAGAYFAFGPAIFRKTDGRVPWSTRFVLAPILIGHYLSLVYYRRQCRAWDEVLPAVLIGRALTEAEAADAVKRGVTAVLDLTAEFSEAAAFRRTRYRNLPILDLTAPTQDQLHEAAAFIAEESANGAVYVHCKIGYSRSAAVVGAYLLASGQAAMIDEAVEKLREVRPSIVVRREVTEALRTFANREPSSNLRLEEKVLQPAEEGCTSSKSTFRPSAIVGCARMASRKPV